MTARTVLARFAAALAIFAAPAALAQSSPTPPDPATAMLLQCMKMPAGSAQQNQCMTEVRRLHASMQTQAAQAAQQPRIQMPKASLATTAKAAPSAPPPPPPPVPSEVKAAAHATGLAGMQPTPASSLVTNGNITVKDLSGMDLETAMMTIQSQRANILEGQLKSQIEAVEARNNAISEVNTVIVKLNQLLAAYPADARSDAQVGSVPGYLGPQAEFKNGICGCRPEQEINAVLYRMTLQPFLSQGRGAYDSYGRRLDDKGQLTYGPDYGQSAYYWKGGIGGNTSKGQVEAAVAALRGQIDVLNNSQQMDMLKLQSLTNKRNEAFDLMTNFVKKMADSRSSILGNMR